MEKCDYVVRRNCGGTEPTLDNARASGDISHRTGATRQMVVKVQIKGGFL